MRSGLYDLVIKGPQNFATFAINLCGLCVKKFTGIFLN